MTPSTGESTPRDVFLHLLSVITLYISAVSLLTLLFQYINYWFRDPLNPTGISDPIRWAIASLIIIFPAHIIAAYFLNKLVVADPGRREGKLRRWIAYLTLFIATGTLIGDLVALVVNFLQGELSARFYLKVLAVALVAGAVLLYYWWDLRRSASALSSRASWSIRGAIAAVAVAVVGSFFVIASPFTQRELRFDSRRVSDLQGIQWQIVNYWQQKEKLPASLADLNDAISGYSVPTDPVTRENYQYRAIGATSFELCADFQQPADNGPYYDRTSIAPAPYVAKESGFENWQHDTGRTCFSRTIDPDLYPPREKVRP